MTMVVGIIVSRIVQIFYMPALLDGEGVVGYCQGSKVRIAPVLMEAAAYRLQFHWASRGSK